MSMRLLWTGQKGSNRVTSCMDVNTSWKRNLYTMCAAQFVANLGFSFVFPFLPLYIEELGITDTSRAAIWSGIIGAGTAVFMALMAPVWGMLADRYGRKMMVTRALFGDAVIIAAMGMIGSVEHLLVLRIVMGCFGGFAAAAMALISAGSPREKLGYSLGLMQMALYSGSAIGPLVGGVIADQIGFRPAFYLTGGVCFAVGLLVQFLVKEQFKAPEKTVAKASFFSGLRRQMRQKQLLTMAGVLLLIQFSTMVVSPILALFVQSLGVAAGETATMSGLIIAVGAFVSAIASAKIGQVSDRYGYRRILVVCTAGAGVSYLLQTFVGSAVQLLALRALLGFFLGGLLPVANALIGRITPEKERATAYGVTTSASFVGNAVGPVSGGLIAAVVSLRAVFAVTALTMLAASAVVAALVGDPGQMSEIMTSGSEMADIPEGTASGPSA